MNNSSEASRRQYLYNSGNGDVFDAFTENSLVPTAVLPGGNKFGDLPPFTEKSQLSSSLEYLSENNLKELSNLIRDVSEGTNMKKSTFIDSGKQRLNGWKKENSKTKEVSKARRRLADQENRKSQSIFDRSFIESFENLKTPRDEMFPIHISPPSNHHRRASKRTAMPNNGVIPSNVSNEAFGTSKYMSEKEEIKVLHANNKSLKTALTSALANLCSEIQRTTQFNNELLIKHNDLMCAQENFLMQCEDVRILKVRMVEKEKKLVENKLEIGTLQSQIEGLKMKQEDDEIEVRNAKFNLKIMKTEMEFVRNSLRNMNEEMVVLKNDNEKLHQRSEFEPDYDKIQEFLFEKWDRQLAVFAEDILDRLNRMQDCIEQQKVRIRKYETRDHRQADMKTKKIEILEQKVHQLMQGRKDDDRTMNELNDYWKEAMESKSVELNEMKRHFETSERIRRGLHDKIMDMKGKVRVFCRVRPPLKGVEVDDGQIFAFPVSKGSMNNQIQLIHPSNLNENNAVPKDRARNNSGNLMFSFDYVFQSGSTQAELYEEVSGLVQSAMYGVSVCVFAYGQTGSGKTYTMQGGSRAMHSLSAVNAPDAGIIGRAIAQIFGSCEEEKIHGWKYEVSMEILELYNEKIIDLLGLNENEHQENMEVCKLANNTWGRKSVSNINEVLHTLTKALGRRATRETRRNQFSSRSHLIITLNLLGKNDRSCMERRGSVNLVDLAGSESLGATVKDQEADETKFINKSLSALSRCVNNIAMNLPFVPYRDSILTQCLRPGLDGNSKTLMICNLAPLLQNYSESKNTMVFAQKVNTCGGVKTKVKSQEKGNTLKFSRDE